MAVDGVVDAALAAGLEDACTAFNGWDGTHRTPLRFELRTLQEATPRAPSASTAVFLTGGVDSAAALMENHRRYHATHPRRIGTALAVYGLDESTDGDPRTTWAPLNCGRCEKCLRTMIGLIVEGASPLRYGFDVGVADALRRARRRFRTRGMVFGEGPHWFWREIQERAGERLAEGGPPAVDGVDVRPFFRWLAAFDLGRYRRQWGLIGRVRAALIRFVRRWPRVTRLVMRGMASVRSRER